MDNGSMDEKIETPSMDSSVEEDTELKDEGEYEDSEEEDAEDIAIHADDKIDALINILITKGLITEEEINKEYESFFEEDDSEETD